MISEKMTMEDYFGVLAGTCYKEDTYPIELVNEAKLKAKEWLSKNDDVSSKRDI